MEERDEQLRARAFGLVLRAVRQRMEQGQDAFAAAWGVSVPTLKRCEAGRSQPQLDSVLRLSGVLGIAGAELVAVVEGLAEALVAGFEGPIGGTRRRRPGDPLEVFAEDWLAKLTWEPRGGEGLLASFPRRAKPSRASLVAWPRDGDQGERSLQDGAASPDRAGPDTRELEREIASRLLGGVRGGHPRVGARFPPSLEAGRVAAAIVELAGRALRVCPLLFVSDRPAGRRAFLDAAEALGVEAEELRSGSGSAELATCDPWVARELLNGAGWACVVVEDAARAHWLGLRGRAGSRGGAVFAILDNTLFLRPSKLRELVGRAPESILDVGEALATGLLPPLRYRGLPDPISHRGLRRHLGFVHPGERGPGLSRDERLQLLADSGEFTLGERTLVHVADEDQQAWAAHWLRRRAPSETVLPQLAQRVAHYEPGTSYDELVLLSPEYPQLMLQQIAQALQVAPPSGLLVGDLLGDDMAAMKRVWSLLRWLGEPPGVHRTADRSGRREGPGWEVEWRVGGG